MGERKEATVVQEYVDSGLAQDGGIGDDEMRMTWDTLRGRADITCSSFGCWGEPQGMTFLPQSSRESPLHSWET